MGQNKVKALVLNNPGEFKVTDIPLNLTKEHALLKVNAATICGSDLRIFKGEMEGIPYPLVPGHEWCATVMEAPESYKHLIGKNVVPDILQSCGLCNFCSSHRPNLCNTLEEPGISVNGGFAEYLSMRPSHLHVIPETLSDQESCLIEPLAVAIYAEQRVKVTPEDTVMIIGGGIIGLLIAQVVRTKNPKKIILIDNHNNRLEMAKLLAVDETINPNEEDVTHRLNKHNSEPPTVAFEVTGSTLGFNWCLEHVQKGGKIGIVGYSGSSKVNFSTATIMVKLLEIIGVLSPTGTVPEAIELVKNGQIKLSGLVSHILPLSEFGQALNLAGQHKGSTLRVCITP